MSSRRSFWPSIVAAVIGLALLDVASFGPWTAFDTAIHRPGGRVVLDPVLEPRNGVYAPIGSGLRVAPESVARAYERYLLW